MDKDCYSIDSQYIETLNILRPPVKRVRKNNQGDYLDVVTDSAKLQFGRNITKVYRSQGESTNYVTDVRSSLSLVLQKTCKKQIYETYSYIDSESAFQGSESTKNPSDTDKPLLRITVIPKTDQQPHIKRLENNNNVASKFKKTTIQNCYQTKNLYLIVAGGKREKIYKVKTTSSTKTLRETTQVDNVEILKANSNEMEKKKKKLKKDSNENGAECVCSCKECLQDNLVDDVTGKSSRVKIFGHLGIDNNDEYVLKCAATVNGQPVPTNSLTGFQQNDEDAFLYQVQSRYNNTTKESQGTQVDIKLSASIPNDKGFKHQKIQCNLCKLHNQIKINTNEEPDINKVKESSSPLVIISVYPNQELRNNQMAENTVPYKPEEIRVNNLVVDAGSQITKKHLKYDKKPNKVNSELRAKRDRSPSPRKRLLKNETQMKLSNVNSRNGSPKIKSKQSPQGRRDQSLEKKVDKKLTAHEQKSKNVIKSHFAGNREVGKKQNANTKSQLKLQEKNNYKTQATTAIDKTPKNTGNLINKHYRIKDNNGVHINSPHNEKSSSKNDISKVSVNIDSEKEYYDVVFEKGQFQTDLFVRKSTKDVSSNQSAEDKHVQNLTRQSRKDHIRKKYLKDNFENEFETNSMENNKDARSYSEERVEENLPNNMSDSLENFFPVESSVHHRRSVSQAFQNLPYFESPVTEHASGIYVRDSLELSHRRDARDSKSHFEKHQNEYYSTEEADEDIEKSVPIKHFTGDNCPVCDPVQRDKEIRRLLGISKRRKEENDRDNYDKPQEDNDDCSTDDDIIVPSNQHLYHNALCQILVTNLMIRKSCSCPSCTKKRMARFGKVNIIKCLNMDDKNKLQDQEYIHIDAVVRSREEIKKIDPKAKVKMTLMKSHSTQYESLEKISKCPSEMKENHLYLNIQPNLKQKTIRLSRKQYRKVKQSLRKCQHLRFRMNWNRSIVSIGEVKAKTKSNYMMYWHKEVQTAQTEPDTKKRVTKSSMKCTATLTDVAKCNDAKKPKINERKDAGDSHTVVLFARECGDNWNKTAKRTVSSIDMHINSVIRLKDPTGSYTNFITLGSSNQERKRRNSIETIFRDNRKTHTPNLGTSALSLQTETIKTVSKSDTLPNGSRPRKPFLRRLMSCLVMRTVRASELKMGQVKQPTPTLSSSFDSYHINTSLGAVEMGTSLYDTADSFYTNHTVGPITSKIKRGFLSSVRGFLSSRKN